MNDFIDFKKLLPKAIERYNMTRETRAAQICARFSKLAPSIIGEDSLQHVRAKYFKGNTLYLGVPNSMWAQRVYVHRHELITKLNLHLENDWVHEIRTLVEGDLG